MSRSLQGGVRFRGFVRMKRFLSSMLMPRIRSGSFFGALGVLLIWLFLIFFLIYPLIKLFIDGFTNAEGRWTIYYYRLGFLYSLYECEV
jgi:hypothetical protein